MAGRGSLAGLLAYGNANEIVKEMAIEVLPVVKKHAGARRRQRHRPVRADAATNSWRAEGSMGFSGVQNFPTIGLFDGAMRQSFEETGMGYAPGGRHDRRGAPRMDLLTTPYVFNPDEAVAMTKAGADIVVAIWASPPAAPSARRLAQVARRVRRPRSTPWSAAARGGARRRHRALPRRPHRHARRRRHMLKHCDQGVHGFYGAASMERLPAERSIAEQVSMFAAIDLAAARP
jgi:predicted TIM-barrel enzyme